MGELDIRPYRIHPPPSDKWDVCLYVPIVREAE
ncbi:MAG: hypothetical protein JWL69_3750 [Phycisphaerales bacterium]|jgi:hypothetical protein|nr:hypothetical protein [Phycisphaerales bacterium]MDB5355632.1 hypothetical protein [Phycisphaerales bacterium]